MSQDHDPLDETLRFQPIDPYNIGPDTAGAPLADVPEQPQSQSQAPETGSRRPGGVKQRLSGLGAPKLVALGAGLAIVVGGVAWGTSAALASSKPGPAARVQAPAHNPADGGATAGTGTGKKAKNAAKAGAKGARVTITKLDTGSFSGTDGKGDLITVVYGDDTVFGTKARPLTVDQLQVGMTVTVAGTRADDKITALAIVPPRT